jgi:hypothetical protein
MKKIIHLLLLFLIIAGCKDTVTEVEYPEIPLEDEIQLNSVLKVKVDPRIELLSVVQHFTTWADNHHTKYESRYKSEVQKFFSKYSNHKAVQLSQDLTNAGFTYDAPPAFVLYHTNPPTFEKVSEYSDYLIGRAGSKARLEAFANELRNFASETNFSSFLETRKSYFIKIENDIKRTIGSRDYIKIIEDYYGEKKNSYNIIPASLFHAGGYGILIKSAEGDNIYDICGPLSSSQGIPNFGNEESFQSILLHEFSHSFVNPITENYKQEINKCSKLFDPIRSKMENMAYNTWEICVNEHLVRTNVARFFNQLQGKDEKNTILKEEYDKGFIYIYDLDSLMQTYEFNRIKYQSYADFYPEILKYFELKNN